MCLLEFFALTASLGGCVSKTGGVRAKHGFDFTGMLPDFIWQFWCWVEATMQKEGVATLKRTIV